MLLSAHRSDLSGVPEPHQPEAAQRRGGAPGACHKFRVLSRCHVSDQTVSSAPLTAQLVEDCEERLAEDEVTDLLRIIAELL